MKMYSLTYGLALLALVAIVPGCKKDNADRPPVVNAGLSQTITLPVDSVRLSGSAQAFGTRVISYLWSEVSGPNVPVISSEGSPSTAVHGLVAGSYIFQLMAVDSLGETGVDTLMVTVNSGIGKTIVTDTLHIAGTFANPFQMHLMGNSSTDASAQLAPELDAGTWTVNGVVFYVRAGFRFDLSAIPAGTPVKSAKLTLYSNPTPLNGDHISANSGPNNAFYIQRINADWSPLTTTWLTQPATDTTGQVLIPHTNSGFLDVTDVDVTTMVNNMISSGNYGFKIQLQNEAIYNIRVFCSARYSDSTKYPKLVVTF